MHGVMDVQFIVRELQIRQSQSNRAHRTCGTVIYMPSLIFRFNDMLLSPFVFRRWVSHRPGGALLSPSPASCRDFINPDAAHVAFEDRIGRQLLPVDREHLFPIDGDLVLFAALLMGLGLPTFFFR